MKKYYFLAFAITLVAFLAIGSNLLITYARKADQKLTEDLEKIERGLSSYTQDYSKLPRDVDELTEKYVSSLNNPISEYEYERLNQEPKSEYGRTNITHKYRLCAVFNKETKDEYSSSYDDQFVGFNYHKAGRQCFERSEFVDTTDKTTSTDIDLIPLGKTDSLNSNVRQ